MAKWYGNVGFSDTVETEPGLWEEQIIERPYYGDVVSTRWRRDNTTGVNANVTLSKQISIVADPYAINQSSVIAYVEYMGAKWQVTEVNPEGRRIILTVGGVWNENSQ